MATNPMQRKARNSFLGGMLVMLVIALVIGGAGYFLLTSMNKVKNVTSGKGEEMLVYVLSQDVKSGDKVEPSMLKTMKIYSGMIPSNYIDQSFILKMQEAEITAVAKVDIAANTLLTKGLISAEEDNVTSDVRYIEYNMLTMPTKVGEGDYIDVRLTLPNGQDLIVISKKKIMSIQGTTIGMNLTEEEILMMNSAIVEAYIMQASNIYVAPYVEAGKQDKALVTYTPTDAVQELIKVDSNIVTAAKNDLLGRFDNGIRAYVNTEREKYSDSAMTNLEQKISTQIQEAKQARENYLTGLQAATTQTTTEQAGTTQQ